MKVNHVVEGAVLRETCYAVYPPRSKRFCPGCGSVYILSNKQLTTINNIHLPVPHCMLTLVSDIYTRTLSYTGLSSLLPPSNFRTRTLNFLAHLLVAEILKTLFHPQCHFCTRIRWYRGHAVT